MQAELESAQDHAAAPLQDRLDLTAGTAQAGGAAASDPRRPHQRRVGEWVDDVLAHLVEIRTGAATRWCPRWQEHPEAVLRLTAIRADYDNCLANPQLGISGWLRTSVDHHLPKLTAGQGPFSGCTATDHEPLHAAAFDPAIGRASTMTLTSDSGPLGPWRLPVSTLGASALVRSLLRCFYGRPDAEAIAQQYAQRAKTPTGWSRHSWALASAEAWPQWAAVAARFPGLSPRNHLLVLAQQPSATLLLCSSEWRDVGRWPKRGSTALRLWQTRPIKGRSGRVTGSADIWRRCSMSRRPTGSRW